MFTGIIEEVGRVAAVEVLGGGRRLRIRARMVPQLRPDQSVALNGACMTVVRTEGDAFEVVAVEESLRKTNLGDLGPGDAVNLERALQPDGRLDGHFVQGHVDAVGEVLAVEALATSWLYRVGFPERFRPYLIPVGSVALDGISLTVARLDERALTVSIIPHTYEKTAIRERWQAGAAVNVEFDMIGKYVVGLMERQAS